METLKKLTDLGFISIFRIRLNDTIDLMHRQIDGMPDLADKVFDEIREESDPNPVDKDNYDEVLNNWVFEQAKALHAETQPSEIDWETLNDAEVARMSRLIDRLDAYYGSREKHVHSTVLRATSLVRVNGLELMQLTEKQRGAYFNHAVQHIAVENGIAID